MTDVKKGNRQMIATPAEAKKLYAPLPDHVSEKIGLEAEMALYRVKSGGVEIPVAAEMTALQKKLNNRGHDTQLEAAGVLEYASAPHPVAETTALMNDVQKGLTDFYQAVADQGLHVAPYCVLPTTTQQEAMDKKVPRERLQAALTAMSQIFDPEVLNIPLITTGVQISFSPKDSDAMFRMMRRAYALTPLLIAAMNSGTGYAENNPAREDIHLRSHYYDLYGPAGGISDSYLQSSSGAELVDHHTQAVFKAKMYFAYDLDDKIILSTKDDVLTFEKLVARGLNTQSNYELAESFLYNDIKICNLRNGAGDVLGKRLEVRAADSGPHQAASTLLLIGTLVPDGAAAAELEDLLKNYGFTGHPPTDAPLLKAARHATVHHNGAYMDVAYGTGQLRDFAADVASLLEKHVTSGPELAKLTDILLTGNCDAKVTSVETPTLQKVVEKLVKMAGPSAPSVAVTPAPKIKAG